MTRKPNLFDRDLVIIEHLSKGKSVRQIASEINDRDHRVYVSLREIMTITQTQTYAGLVGKAMREGWVQ